MGLEPVVTIDPIQAASEIEVVLPVFNGVAYLEEQIMSIANQSLPPVRLIVRDDGSTDGTKELIDDLCYRYGDWLKVLNSDCNLGCIENINRLLAATTAPYIALADQDDVWFVDKLERSLQAIRGLEVFSEPEYPLLIHSDLELINAAGVSLNTTYFRRQHLLPSRNTSHEIVFSNVVTGCTILFNRALLQQACPIPQEALMHDWWLALVASAFGRLELLDGVTVKYRQHATNVLGSKGLGVRYWCNRLSLLFQDPSSGVHTRAAIRQAECFARRYGLPVSRLPALMRVPRWRRWFVLLCLPSHQRPSKHGPLRTFGLWVLLVLLPVQVE